MLEITWDWISLAFIVTVAQDNALYNFMKDQKIWGFAVDPFIFLREDIPPGVYADFLNHERTHIWQERIAGPISFYGSYISTWATLRGEYSKYNVWEWMAKEISGYPEE